MVLSVQKKLLLHVDEQLASYLEVLHRFSTQFSAVPHSLENCLALLASHLQQQGLQARLLTPHLLSVEPAATKPSPTFILCYFYTPHTPIAQTLEDCATFLCALDAYHKVVGPLSIHIQYLLVSSETAQHPLPELDELHEAPDGCLCYYNTETGFNGDTVPVLALGTKGLLHVELHVQTASTMIDTMHGGIVPDSLWRLLWALNSLKDAHEEILIEGFYDTLSPAQDDTVAQLHLLPDIANELLQQWGIQQPLMGLQGFQLRYAHLLLPTCTVTQISSTPQPTTTKTVIPKQAKAHVIFYLVPDQDPQDIFLKLQRHLHTSGFSDISLHLLASSPPISTPMDNSFIQHTIYATEAAYEQESFLLPTTIGSYMPHGMKAGTPLVFLPRNRHTREKDFAQTLKQILLLIEGLSYANDTSK